MAQSLTQMLYAAVAALLCYCLVVIVYRLQWSPIAHFPGPKLAAASFWYEFYFDVIKRGRYYREIEKMHEKYGPVVRINPHELHVNHPDFYPVLYTSSASGKRDKWPWAAKMFGTGHSAFATISHDHHRLRRAALNPFFSKSKIRLVESGILQHTIGSFCSRLDDFCGSGNILNIGGAFAVLAADVISHYCFGRPFGLLKDPDFASDWLRTTAAPSELSHLIKQCSWILSICKYMPRCVVRWIAPSFGRFLTLQEWMRTHVQSLIDSSNNDMEKIGGLPSVFNELLSSPQLPAQERSIDRLKHEGQTLIGAGTLTVAHALKTTVFHTLANPDLHLALVDELVEAFPDPQQDITLAKLERLPILTSYITEGLRLAYGVSHRLQLIASEPLRVNDDFEVPPFTPVGMSAVSMHNHPSAFGSEPRAFRPQRWQGGDEEHLRKLYRHFVPFGRGTRMCLGMHLAWAELYLVLGTTFRRYNLSLYDTSVSDVEMEHDFFDPIPHLGSKGLRVKIESRRKKESELVR